MMEKIKTRWRKNYLEGDSKSSLSTNDESNNINSNNRVNDIDGIDHQNHHHHHNNHHHHHHSKPPTYEPLTENLYLDKRKNEHSRSRKDARSMVCDCILTKEERSRGVMGCLDDCLNRMLMIECGSKCTLGEHCLNKRFQKCQSAKVEMFKTRKKGWGLRTTTELPANSFIMEYVGEVVRSKEFRRRVKKYTKQKIKHHYFMALRSDEIIDATVKGNLTRFINHSCEPNCETQKWTVHGDLRIGFFTLRHLQAGEEITFDYQFQRYGKRAQRCFCEAPSCRGYIGGSEQTFSLNGNSEASPQHLDENKTHKKSFDHSLLVDVATEDKINGFKIPRLNRLQRMELEKKMDDEVISDDQTNQDRQCYEQKNTFSRNYFKSSTTTTATSNGLVSASSLKNNNILPAKRRFDSITTNNIDLTPAPKISKEEHRQKFEMNVRLKDYYETIEKHYRSAALEQIKLSQAAYNSMNGLPLPFHHVASQNLPNFGTNHPLVQPPIPPVLLESCYPPPLVVPPPIPTPVDNYHHQLATQLHTTTLTNHTTTTNNNINNTTNSDHQESTALAYYLNGREYSNDSYHDLYAHHKDLEPGPQEPKPDPDSIVTTSSLNELVIEAEKPEPTKLPTLKVLANNLIESAHAIDDELAFSICDYDEYYSIRDKPLSVDDIIIEDSYPYPGSYYTTPTGETWFATVTLDKKTQQPRTVILNLQIRSETELSLTTSPNKQSSTTQSLYNPIDEPFNSGCNHNNNTTTTTTTTLNTNTNSNITQTAIKSITQSQDTSSIEANTESPTTNNSGDKLPGKIKKKMFEHGVSKFIKDALTEYYKPDCQFARITSKEDFVFLARKLTLAVLEKELNRKGGCERLECNKQVKRKVEDFVRIYMAKFGKLYTRHNKL